MEHPVLKGFSLWTGHNLLPLRAQALALQKWSAQRWKSHPSSWDPGRCFHQKNKGNCSFCEQNTLRQVRYCILEERQSQTKPEQTFLGDGTVKTIPCGKKGEISPRSFPQHCCWKQCCASIPQSTVAGAGFFMASHVCLKQNVAQSGLGDWTDGRVPGRNGSIKTWMRKETAAWFLTLKYFDWISPTSVLRFFLAQP